MRQRWAQAMVVLPAVLILTCGCAPPAGTHAGPVTRHRSAPIAGAPAEPLAGSVTQRRSPPVAALPAGPPAALPAVPVGGGASVGRPSGRVMDRHRRWVRDSRAHFDGYLGRSVVLRFGDLRAGSGRIDSAAGSVLKLHGRPEVLVLSVSGWAAVRAPATVSLTIRVNGHRSVLSFGPGIGDFTQTLAVPVNGVRECRVRIEVHGGGGGFVSVSAATGILG